MKTSFLESGGSFVAFIAVAGFVINLLMALAVNNDAKRLRQAGGGLFLFGPALWAWIVFVFSLAGLALYWAVHHSTLRSRTPPAL